MLVSIALGVDLAAQDKHLEGNTKSTIVSSCFRVSFKSVHYHSSGAQHHLVAYTKSVC